MKNDDLLQTILESYDDSNYPEAFVSEYDIMECLSDQNGICTFLVQKKDGENCIAKCYDKLRWGISDNSAILHNLDHDGLPKHIATFESDTMTCPRRKSCKYVSGSVTFSAICITGKLRSSIVTSSRRISFSVRTGA